MTIVDSEPEGRRSSSLRRHLSAPTHLGAWPVWSDDLDRQIIVLLSEASQQGIIIQNKRGEARGTPPSMKTKESEAMSTFGWDQMTDWGDKQLGDEGDLWDRGLFVPPLLQLVCEVGGSALL